jgi:uncharacterized protein (UPF0332 family)
MTDRQTLFTYRIQQAEVTLNDGKIILAKGGSPQSVINRAYYAVFYCVLALNLKTGITTKTSKHSGIIGIFDKEFILSGKLDKTNSQIFHSLFDDRQEFDYKEQAIATNDQAETALKSAETFLLSIKKYIAEHSDSD